MVTKKKTKKTIKNIKKKVSKKSNNSKITAIEIKKLGQTTQENSFYEKYRWFFTSSGKLVIGGKNSEQNEFLVKELLNSKKNYMVMHTKSPGSPFAILQDEKYDEKDLEEIAIFTASFSRAWKLGAKKAIIDIFNADQIYKKTSMKEGTFGVKAPIKRTAAELKLYLTKQKGKLRAVPFKVKDAICIIPGKEDKEQFANQISVKLEIPFEEVLNALPTGNFQIR